VTVTPAPKPPFALAVFIQQVAAKTGLNALVVWAWALAEGGPSGNPLNLRPGTNYGSPQAAANAVATQINSGSTSTMIRAAAKSGNPRAQLQAIIASPWDAGHYSGSASAAPGSLLYGTYARVTAAASSSGGGITGGIVHAAGSVNGIIRHTPGVAQAEGALGGITDAVHTAKSIPGAISGALSDTEHFVVDKSVLALLYVGLTILSLALIFVGLSKTTGVRPPSLAGGGGFTPASEAGAAGAAAEEALPLAAIIGF
jgi:hypothetical protein